MNKCSLNSTIDQRLQALMYVFKPVQFADTGKCCFITGVQMYLYFPFTDYRQICFMSNVTQPDDSNFQHRVVLVIGEVEKKSDERVTRFIGYLSFETRSCCSLIH